MLLGVHPVQLVLFFGSSSDVCITDFSVFFSPSSIELSTSYAEMCDRKALYIAKKMPVCGQTVTHNQEIGHTPRY